MSGADTCYGLLHMRGDKLVGFSSYTRDDVLALADGESPSTGKDPARGQAKRSHRGIFTLLARLSFVPRSRLRQLRSADPAMCKWGRFVVDFSNVVQGHTDSMASPKSASRASAQLRGCLRSAVASARVRATAPIQPRPRVILVLRDWEPVDWVPDGAESDSSEESE